MSKSKKPKKYPTSKNKPNAKTIAAFDDVPYDPNDKDAVKAFWDGAVVKSGECIDYEEWKDGHIKEGLRQVGRGEFVLESQWRKAFNRKT